MQATSFPSGPHSGLPSTRRCPRLPGCGVLPTHGSDSGSQTPSPVACPVASLSTSAQGPRSPRTLSAFSPQRPALTAPLDSRQGAGGLSAAASLRDAFSASVFPEPVGVAGGGRSGDPRAELLPVGGRHGLQTLEGGGAARRSGTRRPALREDERKADPRPAGSHLGTAAASSPLLSVRLQGKLSGASKRHASGHVGAGPGRSRRAPPLRLGPQGLGGSPLPGGDPSTEPRAPFWHLPALRL